MGRCGPHAILHRQRPNLSDRIADRAHYFCTYRIYKLFKLERSVFSSPAFLERLTLDYRTIHRALFNQKPPPDSHASHLCPYKNLRDQQENLAKFPLIDVETDKTLINNDKADVATANKLKEEKSKTLSFLPDNELANSYMHTFVGERWHFQKALISDRSAEKHNPATSYTLETQKSSKYSNTYLDVTPQDALLLGPPLSIPYYLCGITSGINTPIPPYLH